ncbi:GH1 family beta-glucosidase [Actinomadura verrucosospora]|uniref:Beta-glucosidase n=1 Tax=Actinomadura verrucosospora TaxID=46165 RepID=A0A7D4A3S3_ACTVE|nr:GH1 family beta-glucosidase [Actinomadura verrucosospora]QKG21885.1 Thermostable beta-glucosidase B [Actinomadura verrucosospora]
MLPRFPEGFVWGTATSSYQIEGAVHEDGRGASIWDSFCARPGAIRNGDTADVACDHYHRWPEDVALMAGLGVNAYRFSVAWPRIQPEGRGPANPKGLDFYDRLVDALAEHGIAPALTLYHWDLPQALQDAGGWMNRDTAHRFAEYAGLVADRLGDRVPTWITLNEPFVHMTEGHALGVHAPGEALLLDALPVAHHLLLGHGLAVPELRGRTSGQVLITNNYSPVWTATDSAADRAAATAFDALQNRLFTDPVLLGRYPDLSAYGVDGAFPFVQDGDMNVIAAPLDGLGVNYYSPTRVAAPNSGVQSGGASVLSEVEGHLDGTGLPFEDAPIDGYPVTAFGWPVVPEGLREMLLKLRDRYGAALPPILVTENGCSVRDEPGRPDQERIDFLDGHLRALHQAIADGVDVRGYFVWSLLDNFEWAEGYEQRFGLVHVDFATQRRTPKASYHWLRERLAEYR